MSRLLWDEGDGIPPYSVEVDYGWRDSDGDWESGVALLGEGADGVFLTDYDSEAVVFDTVDSAVAFAKRAMSERTEIEGFRVVLNVERRNR